ncbi:cell wall protein Ecm33 [Ascochyta clinopodiicola]|nr:cell wall protein Ecm33 [Ascochyta clinopodiicola]
MFAINSTDDVATLNQCTTFIGDVSITAKGIDEITLNGLKAVTGTLQITDVKGLLSISSTTLESVSTLILKELPTLTTLTLPALTNFSKLDFADLTALNSCEIATGGLQSDVHEVSIANTALETMDWLKWPVSSTLTISSNTKLTEFKLPYDRISAGSSYQISINSALSNLDFSQLTGIYGSLTINGNRDSQMNFDKLQTIDGYVRLSGPFTNVTMPALTGINGALRAESTKNILNFCNWLSVQNQLLGHYDCTANSTNSSTSSTESSGPTATVTTNSTSGGANSSDNKSNLSTGAIIGIAVAMVIVMSMFLTASTLLFCRRRSRHKVQATVISEEGRTRSSSTLGKALNASGEYYELGGEKLTHELPGSGPVKELDSKNLQELEERPYHRDQKPSSASPTGRFELP